MEICPTKVIVHSDHGIQIMTGEETPAKTLEWFPVVCDLCGGEPECARICPTEAIYIDERKAFDPQESAS